MGRLVIERKNIQVNVGREVKKREGKNVPSQYIN